MLRKHYLPHDSVVASNATARLELYRRGGKLDECRSEGRNENESLTLDQKSLTLFTQALENTGGSLGDRLTVGQRTLTPPV